MIQISEKQYKKIRSLQNRFYMGVDKYCNDLQDTWDFIRHFEEIMGIIENSREGK